MLDKDIQLYEKSICITEDGRKGPARLVYSSGYASCNLDLKVALSFATMYLETNFQPVLFVISC